MVKMLHIIQAVLSVRRYNRGLMGRGKMDRAFARPFVRLLFVCLLVRLRYP